MTKPTSFHLHLVSDATGETIHSVARACLAQFEGVVPVEHFWNLVRSDAQLDMVIEEIEQYRGVVVYTLVDERLRRRLHEVCVSLEVPIVSVLDPIIGSLAQHLGVESQSRPGYQHAINAAYFGRMDAMEFALTQDDGQSTDNLYAADVILVGVSRTSKTPTCLYLANRGIKAANVPFVPNCPMPEQMGELKRPLIVGLTKDPDQLVEIRRNRLRSLHQTEASSYYDPEAVRDEVREARRYYLRHGWPIIDVSHRAIEETAAEILSLMSRRRARQDA